jgi:hypothetical protein
MTMRKTPYARIRYPWTADVVSAADVQTTASDIDAALVQTATMASTFSTLSSVSVKRAAVQSITKGTLTAVTFDTVVSDNGKNSPLANGAWFAAGSPTRLTAPSPCIVLATAVVGMNFTAVLGTSGVLQCTIALNGATGQPNVQGNKWAPISSATGQQWTSALAMWKLAAGDFLELKVFWTGTPAGPLNTDNVIPPQLSLMMVGLPSVP